MFKKVILSILLVVLSLGIFPVVSFAEVGNYFNVSYGSKEEKASFAFGNRFTNSILEFGYILKNDKTSTSDFDFGMGLDVLYCKDILEDQLTLYVGPGLYHNWYSKETNQTKTEFKFTYSLGIQWHMDESLGFGLGYHSERGLTGQVICTY